MRPLLLCLLVIVLCGLVGGCGYDNLYENYNTYHDKDTKDLPPDQLPDAK